MKYLLLAFAFIPFTVLAQDIVNEEEVIELAMGPHTPMLKEMMDKLEIGADLKTKIEDLWYQHQKEMLDARYNIEKKEMELMDILRKDDFSIEKFQAKWKEIQQLKNDMELKILNFKISVYKLLPKEKAKEAKHWLFCGKEEIRKKIIKKVMEKEQEHRCTQEQKQEHKCTEEQKQEHKCKQQDVK